MADDRHKAEAFDRFLDRLVLGRGSHHATSHDDLSRFAHRVQATAIAPPPDRAFGQALRQSLLTDPAGTVTRERMPLRPIRRRSRTVSDAPVSRWRPAVELAAKLLVIVAMIGGIRSGDRLWSAFDPADDGQFIATDDASPAPSIPAVDSTCETPPRTLTEMTALVATPTADPFDPIADAGGTRPPIEAVHGVLHTLEQINACAAEGNLLALYDNFSNRFVRRHLGPASATDPAALKSAMADPPMVRWPPTVEHISIDTLVQPRGKLVVTGMPLLLADGRVRVGIGDWLGASEYASRYTVLFVQSGERWLVDEVFEAEPLVVEVPAVVVEVVVPDTIAVIEAATPATPTD